MKLFMTGLLILYSFHSYSQEEKALQDSLNEKDSSNRFQAILKSDDFFNKHLRIQFAPYLTRLISWMKFL